MSSDSGRLLRHFLAALAYRTTKAVRGAPEAFGAFRTASGVRTPHQLVHHMSGVLLYAHSFFEPTETWRPMRDSFEEEIEAFHEVLEALSYRLDRDAAVTERTAEELLQGPFADAMTHAGQLAMLRRLAGSPIPPEDFSKADIRGDNVSADQPTPRSPDATWRDAEGRDQLG